MITFVGDTEDGVKAVREFVKMFAQDIEVSLDLSERSGTILYWQAVNHGRDATEAFGDIEDGEVEQCFSDGVEDIANGGFYLNARRDAADKMGALLRKYLIAGIDDEDLIATGELRRDAETADVVVEQG